MFSCLWNLWDWLDPTSMENKKGIYTSNSPVAHANETPLNEAIPKHQHNTAPQHLRLLQYGFKIPNYQHQQLSQTHQHQKLNSPNVHPHIHQQSYQSVQSTTHRHLQPSPQNQQYTLPNIHQQNVSIAHQHFQTNQQQYIHHHQQQKQNQTFYQPNQPQSAHMHNPLNQHNPQIWVPHQPPLHYHHQQQQQQQQQNKAEPQQKQNTNQTNQQNKQKDVEKKKSNNSNSSNQQLRSPSAKRPIEAPVTMQGWLHKQGSEGLMLWKKRWFVLSEYCLFYYKGPEEEKLLGSILLPSYKVSICCPEDKINKKFAFKCEHANMRTYILAADSHELMMQWIRVLNLACLLQTHSDSDHQSGQSVTSVFNQSTENSDSGFHQQYTQNQNYRTTPVHMYSSSNTTDLSNPSQQELSQYSQPLYANAPPKPRRLNDGGYSSPSPDVLDRNVAKSPVNLYGTNGASLQQHPEYITHAVHPHQPRPECGMTPPFYNVPPNVERRTPDTYGRSKLNPSKSRPTDYEDVYGDNLAYKRPLSPIAYTNIKKANPVLMPIQRTYTPVSMLGPRDLQYAQPQMRKSPSAIPRPHSADFLEYEVNHRQGNLNAVNRQQPRPKSSLDINRNTSNDNYFYSEERYAEKMRRSAQYLPKMPRYAHTHTEYTLHQQKRPVIPKKYIESDNTFPLMKSSAQPPINYNDIPLNEMTRVDPQPVRSRSVLSEGSLSKELDVDLRSSPHDRLNRENVSPAFLTQQEQLYGYNDDCRKREFDPFTRSASARLAQSSVGPDRIQDTRSINGEGERKREESMKRLLEWKQRMLQSPLNRKINQSSKGMMSKQDFYSKNQENGYQQKINMDSYSDGRRSVNKLPQYNSYSSDDEENEDRSKENVQTQAGRTLDTFPSVSESVTPALTSSITVFNTLAVLDKPSNQNDTVHEYTQNTSTSRESTERDGVTESDTIASDTTFTKPLKQFNKESSNLAYVSSLRSEFSEKFEQSPVITEIKSNGALVKSILAEFEKKTELKGNDLNNKEFPIVIPRESNTNTPVKDFEKIIEENYMTMTPKKNILAPHSDDSLVRLTNADMEENPYVEMTQGIDASFLDTSANQININPNEQQPYEMVCFSEGRIEPVYMELAQLQKKIEILNSKDPSKTELPDILIPSQNKKTKSNKSDSSDADDEASKDLDSLDTPSHPRFSLSDNFRPASYYLGASQTVPEFQDSSDSELVSPPPIPTSPPPLDDLEITDECVSSNQDISLTEQETKQDLYRYNQPNHNTKFIKGSTHSLDNKKRSYLSLNSLRDQDSSSLNSINMENDVRYCSRLSHNSDSDVELRIPSTRNSNYECMLKRRPVSEEFCDELESLDSQFNEIVDSVDLDKYLKDLQIGNLSVTPSTENVGTKNYVCISSSSNKNYHDYENLCIVSHLEKEEKSLSPLINISHSHSRENSKSTVTSHSSQIDLNGRTPTRDEFLQRLRPESSASVSTEVGGILRNSNCSTPTIRISSSLSAQEIPSIPMYFSERKHKNSGSDISFSQPAPYYYSDLSMNTSHTDSSSTILMLNNQRRALNGGKKDITHIVNPIRCNSHMRNPIHTSCQNTIKNTFKLAAEARSVSVDFLNLADKSGQIDKKNIYESDTLKRLKVMDSVSSLQSNPEMRNLYPGSTNEKFNSNCSNSNDTNVRRTHSLEGLLENVLSETTESSSLQDTNTIVQSELSTEYRNSNVETEEGSYLWEEDSIWRERLRSASQRHTKSLDDLDCLGEPKKNYKKQTRAITRGVTYVNDNIYNMPIQDKQQKDVENKKHIDSKKNDIHTKENSFVIDREKLRQWDLLSSAPSDAQLSIQKDVQEPRGSNTVVEFSEEVSACQPSEKSDTQDPASGSISLNMRDTFPRTISTKRIWNPNLQPVQSRSISNLTRSHESDYQLSGRQNQGYYMSQCPSQHDLSSDTSQSNNSRKANWQWEGRMNVSAGELLGRTHEELVLLLIQLRRQSTNTCHAIEACYNEIDTIQSQLHLMDQAKRMENLQKLEQIKQHLLELEKQYEKGKPLVNLVDNMVKLGSLYRTPADRNNLNSYIKDRLEFNQQIQERRLLAEEKRDWNRLNPNHTELQEKVQQLYQLDHLIHEESDTLRNLQQDKEDIERALGGLRHRLNKGFNDPAEIEQARKQQAILENELSRVHLMLAQNSKKLEETVAGNARLEQELLVLKQKLQISRQQRSSPQFSNAGDSLPCVLGTSAMLESDLQKVQQKVGDLQRQRQELSMQVRQLTDRSNNLQQQIKPYNVHNTQNNQALGNKKKMHSLWRETDLDTMNIIDHGDTWDNPLSSPTPTTPLYINTDFKHSSDSDYYNRGLKSSDSTSDDTTQNSNFMPPEKQEIKTVRIVKRESERRQRDREKTATGKWDTLLEEDDSSQSSSVLFRPTPMQKTQSSTNLGGVSPNYVEVDKSSSGILSRQSSLSSPSLPQVYSDVRVTPSTDASVDKSPELSPIFKSEAARQIITEMSIQDTPKQGNRRAVPKEKRRHYTAPHNNIIMKSLNQLPTDDTAFDRMILNNRRARDDLDMERALRQRIDAPDVVRSTLSNKELKYNENTIDNILGTPNKISIPERYIPEQLPQLSIEEQEHRLRKVESIKKMLSDTTIISSSSANLTLDDTNAEKTPKNITNKATTKMIEEKKQREHLLQLNQILAKQVMEMSKIVAVKALAKLPLQQQQTTVEDDDLSPITPLPLYQQRDNFYS